MRQVTIALCFFILFQSHAIAQQRNWEWARSATGSSSESGNAIATDANGNVLVCGYYYSSTLTFGTYTLTNSGNYDFFIVKYDSTGNILWARSGGGVFDDVALGVDTDVSGNIYVTGYFYSPVITAGTFTQTNSGIGDIFIIKYDAAGNAQWLKGMGGAGDDNGNAVSCDNGGNILVTGFHQGTFAAGNFTIVGSGAEDAFVSKLDPSGNLLWLKGFGGTASDKGNGITTDATGNIFVTGHFFSSPFVAGSNSLISAGSSDVFTAKLDAGGNLLWVSAMGGGFNESGANLTTDAAGNAIVIGTILSPTITVGTSTLVGKGNFDFFVLKYDANGIIQWARNEGGALDDNAYGVVTDATGNIYVTGHLHSSQIILGLDTLVNAGVGDFYIAAYDPVGNIKWTEKVGGSSDDGSGAIATDADGNLFVCGFFISPIVSSPGFTVANSGGADIFVGKLKVEKPSTVNISEHVGYPEVIVYPNPAQNKVFISTTQSAVFTIRIYSELGDLVYLNETQGNKLSVDIETFSGGLYLVVVQNEKSQFVKKLVIE